MDLAFFDQALPNEDVADVRVSQVSQLVDRVAVRNRARLTVYADGFRFRWGEVAIFDYRHPGSVEVAPGRDWTGVVPASFFSSVAAFVASAHGRLPLHASTIVSNGRAWLIGGAAGAGKSTLTAELVGAGALLLADDLTVVTAGDAASNGWVAFRGRPTMRLHPASLPLVPHVRREAVPDDPRGKWLVWPTLRADDAAWPIDGVIWLSEGAQEQLRGLAKAAITEELLFRPRQHAQLPGHAGRRQAMLALAAHVPFYRVAPLVDFSEAARGDRFRHIQRIFAAPGGAS